MYAEERQQAIARHARADGRVEVTELAEIFGVTTETIRRDLTTLERRGFLKRVHGGAIPIERLGFEPEVAMRDTVMTAEKDRIAKMALADVPEEGAVILDSGTTTARLADALPHDRKLTVITNSVPIALKLSSLPNATVMMLGGRVRGRTLAAVDVWAMRALEETFAEVAFIGTNGISVQRGLTTPDPTEAAVKRAMIASARRAVVLSDHTKVGNDNLMRFGELSQIDAIITDAGLDQRMRLELEAAGPRVVLA